MVDSNSNAQQQVQPALKQCGVLRRFFHSHNFVRVHGSEKLLGFFHGAGIWNVEYRCNVCGKRKDIQTDSLI